jgi:ankyrin repeat protein
MTRSRHLLAVFGLALLGLAPAAFGLQAPPPATPPPATPQPEITIHEAAMSGDVAAVTRLLERDPSLIDAAGPGGGTPLAFAVAFGHLEAAKLLIAKGADVNAREARGISVFDIALWRGRTEACRLLLEKGADASRPGPAGMTPLHSTITSGSTDIMHMLIERKVALDVRDQFGNTPLLLAVREGADDAARALIAAGADVNAGSPLTGDGPLDVALERGDASLAEALRARGAKPRADAVGPRRGPYLGQAPPRDVPVMFAPNLVSTERGELNAVFSPEGREFYFARSDGQRRSILQVLEQGGTWGRPERVAFPGDYGAVDMAFSPDGTRLYFCSNRPLSGTGEAKKDHDIWVVTRTAQGWGEPTTLGDVVNSPADDYYPTFTAAGDLYFSSRREGGKGGNDIYRSRLVDGKFQPPENLGVPVNTERWEFDPFIAPDGSFLLFASSRPGGLGDSDLYISFRGLDGSWSEPRNLGAPVNSIGPDYTPMLTPDGKYLFYTSGPTGPDDIYWVEARVLDRFRPEPAKPATATQGAAHH